MRNERDDSRLLSFGIIITLIFLVLIGRLYYLQIYKGERFKELSEGNRTSVIPINAPRGKIYDKNKKVLVSNRLAYTVSIIPNKIDKLDYTLRQLSQILDIDLDRLKDKMKDVKGNKSIRVKKNISRKELILLEENKKDIPGIIIEKTPMREYVYNDLASHVLGYVGDISNKELNRLVSKGYDARDIVGKTGLELTYEKYLRGTEGKKLIEVNSLGQKVKTLGTEKPITGHSLVLNLDYKLQKTVERVLEKEIKLLAKQAQADEEITQPPRGGAVIVSNPNDGSILAMASYPDYNLNNFSQGISTQQWKELNENNNNPLLNRAISTSAPSGSIFKIVTAVAGMEELGIKADTKFYDPGYYETGGVRFNNWATVARGELDFLEAIAWSNNPVFFQIGHKLYKKDKTVLQEYARKFGLGSKTGIDLNSEATGLVPDPEWRKNYFKKYKNKIWYPGYTINLSIGQGNLRTSPIQLVNLVSAVANGGKLYRPTIVDKIIDEQGKLVKDLKPKLLNDLSVSQHTLEVVKKGMTGVTTYGTARSAFKDFPVTVAGKTGTAQTGGDRPNHGWFAGLAPANNPEISIVVFIEYGASSANTLPIVKKVIKKYFNLEITSEANKPES